MRLSLPRSEFKIRDLGGRFLLSSAVISCASRQNVTIMEQGVKSDGHKGKDIYIEANENAILP